MDVHPNGLLAMKLWLLLPGAHAVLTVQEGEAAAPGKGKVDVVRAE